MKRVCNVNKVITVWFVYMSDHKLGDDDDLKTIPSLSFDNEDQAIGAAQALLIAAKSVYYTCVIKSTKYIDDEELYSEIIWEAEATDDEKETENLFKSKMYS